MFDFNMDDDPTGPSDHIRSTLAFLDNNIRREMGYSVINLHIDYLDLENRYGF